MTLKLTSGIELNEVRNLTEDSAHDIIVTQVQNSSAAKMLLALTDYEQQEKLYQALTNAYLWLLELGLCEHEKVRETHNIHDLDWNSIRWELDHGTIYIPDWTPVKSFYEGLYDVHSLLLTANIIEALFLAELEDKSL